MIKKKIVLVTGGTSGIGLGIVSYLLEQSDYEVVSFSLDKAEVKNVLCLKGDITNLSDCQKVYKEIEKKYGRLDGLVNCAGIIKRGGIEEQTIEEWNKSLNINLTGAFILSKTLLPLLKKGHKASIVNISSIHSEKPGSSISYCAAKAGLDMMTEYMALDLAKYQIRVNTVNPGAVKTNLYLSSGDFTKEQLDELFEARNMSYPLGRVGDAKKDIAPVVEFLLSDKSLWVTGAHYEVDGGKLLG